MQTDWKQSELYKEVVGIRRRKEDIRAERQKEKE